MTTLGPLRTALQLGRSCMWDFNSSGRNLLQPCRSRLLAGQRVRTFRATQCVACTKIRAKETQDEADIDSDTAVQKFHNIYIFRYIVHTRVLSRLKIYQTLITVGALPPSTYLHYAGELSTSSFGAFIGVASLATVMLYVMSSFFRRIVGIISVNQDQGIVRISHLTFWGHRRNVEFSTSDIVPLSDVGVNPNEVYQIIRFYDHPERFYWFLRHGKIVNKDVIEQIFGKI